MTAPLLRRLQENLASVFGPGMAPFVVRRACRAMDRDEDAVEDRDVRELLDVIERTSLERIYGGQARPLAAELWKHVNSGTVIDQAAVRSFSSGGGAVARARELL